MRKLSLFSLLFLFWNPENLYSFTCPEDAKICPDGRIVVRGGKDCSFPKCPPAPSMNLEEMQKCTEDSDCVIVNHKHCCGSTKLALNKRFKKMYERIPAWQSYQAEECSVIGKCADDSKVKEAHCKKAEDETIAGKCYLVFPR